MTAQTTDLLDNLMYGETIPTAQIYNAVLDAMIEKIKECGTSDRDYYTYVEATNADGATTTIEVSGDIDVLWLTDECNCSELDYLDFDIDNIEVEAIDNDGEIIITPELIAAQRIDTDRLKKDIIKALR